MHKDLGSWRKVAKVLRLNARTVWRYAMTDYIPKRSDIRKALGLDSEAQVTYVRQVRSAVGAFEKDESEVS